MMIIIYSIGFFFVVSLMLGLGLALLRILAKPIAYLVVFSFVALFLASFFPILLPLGLYDYYFNKKRKTIRLKRWLFRSDAEKEIESLYGASLEEIKENPKKDYGYIR